MGAGDGDLPSDREVGLSEHMVTEEAVGDIDLSNPDTILEMMDLAFDHYQKHRGVILKKMEYARRASAECVCEVARLNEAAGGAAEGELMQAGKYECIWNTTISVFEGSYVSEDTLKKIENLLSSLPLNIKKHYDSLVGADDSLLNLIEVISGEKYITALRVVGGLQDCVCPLSGLSSDEFEIDA